MDENPIIIPVIPEIDTKGIKTPLNEIEKEIKKHIGEPLNDSFAKVIDKEKKLAISFVKYGKKFQSILLKYDKDNKIVGLRSRKLSGALSKSEVKTLLESESEIGYSDTLKSIQQAQLQRKKKAQDIAKQKKKDEEARNRKAEKEKLLREKQEQKLEEDALEQLKLEEEKKIELEQIELKRTRGMQFLSLIGQTMDPLDSKRIELEKLKKDLSVLEKRFADVGEEGSLEFKEISKRIKDTQSQINELNKELKESSRISPFQKLINTFKRVGFYRLARRTFSFIEKGFGEGLKGLAKNSSDVNRILSSLATNAQNISNSFIISLYPAIKLIEPVLRSISQIIGKLGEGISYLGYQLGITSSWFKINSNYLKEFNEQANKLSFDKFESLDIQEEDMFEEMFGNASNALKSISDTLRLIAETLLVISGYEFIKWIYNNGISKLNKDLDSAFNTLDSGAQKSKNSFQKLYDSVNSVYLAIAGISMVIDGIVDIINWDETTSGLQKTLDILKIIFGAVAGIAGIVASFLPDGYAKVAKAIAFGSTLAGIVTIGVEKITTVAGYANGGIVDSGSLFIAGEAGAELVTTMPSGQTGVTNIAQFKQAMLEALYTWSANSESSNQDIVLNIDGAEIARSKRFNNEMNIRNVGLNLR